MHRRALALIATVVFGLAASGCSDDDKETDAASGADQQTTTTTGESASTTTTAGATPAGPATSPAAAAKGLLAAWEKGDKNDASRYARQRAIDVLFSHPNTGDVEYVDQGCEPVGGQFRCSWTYPGGVMQMTVEGVLGTNGFVVDNVTYIAD